MDDGGGGGGGDNDAHRIAAVRSAAADARMRAASIRGKAALAEYRSAWEANAEVNAALMRAARSHEGAAKARGGIDEAAVGRASAEFGEAAEAAVRTSAALPECPGWAGWRPASRRGPPRRAQGRPMPNGSAQCAGLPRPLSGWR